MAEKAEIDNIESLDDHFYVVVHHALVPAAFSDSPVSQLEFVASVPWCSMEHSSSGHPTLSWILGPVFRSTLLATQLRPTMSGHNGGRHFLCLNQYLHIDFDLKTACPAHRATAAPAGRKSGSNPPLSALGPTFERRFWTGAPREITAGRISPIERSTRIQTRQAPKVPPVLNQTPRGSAPSSGATGAARRRYCQETTGTAPDTWPPRDWQRHHATIVLWGAGAWSK